MTLPNNQPASAVVEPEKAQPLEQPANVTPAPPASVEEPFDRERAMNTIHQLREIEKQAKRDAKELEHFKAEEQKRKDADLSEAERLRKQLDDMTKAKTELEMSVMRRDVIAETGLPAAFADRLKGATKDELLADAKALKESLPQLKQQSQPVTNPGNASMNETDAQKRERLFGPQGNTIFDMESVKKMGGGVVNSK